MNINVKISSQRYSMVYLTFVAEEIVQFITIWGKVMIILDTSNICINILSK
jgi:hypothetical protein